MRLDEKKDIMEKLSGIFSEYTDREVALSEDTDIFEELDLNSVDIMCVIVRTEKVFGIEFEDVDLLSENFQMVGSFCELIQKQLEKGIKNAEEKR